jgi:ATP/maltotriose-dependent transcriptional regulator MalT
MSDLSTTQWGSTPAAQLLLSEISVDQGELARALEYCQQAEQLAAEMGLHIYLMDALLIRGDIASKQGKHTEAREYVEQASMVAQQLNHAHGIALVNEKRERLLASRKANGILVARKRA